MEIEELLKGDPWAVDSWRVSLFRNGKHFTSLTVTAAEANELFLEIPDNWTMIREY